MANDNPHDIYLSIRRRFAVSFAALALLLTACGGESELALDRMTDPDEEASADVDSAEEGANEVIPQGTPCPNPGHADSLLYFDTMNEQLERTETLRDSLGFSEVMNCDQALAFMAEINRVAEAEEDDDEVLAPVYAEEPRPELVDKIHIGRTVPYDAVDPSVSGVVRLKTSRGKCTAFGVSEWHLLTSAHCFSSGGRQDIEIWGFNASGNWAKIATSTGDTTIEVFAYLHPNFSGDGNRTNDLALVTMQRNFVEHLHRVNAYGQHINLFRMYGGSTRRGTRLYILGTGVRTYNGSGENVLRQGRDGARIKVNDSGTGWFGADAKKARTCKGDSGGPAIEWPTDTPPVVWGTAAGASTWFWHDDLCPHEDANMYWTKLNVKLDWIEQTMRNNVNLGSNFSCPRFTHPSTGHTYLRCW